MSDSTADVTDEGPKGRAKGLLLVVVLVLIAGGGGFAAVWLGALGGLLGSPEASAIAPADPARATSIGADVVFQPLDPIAVSVGSGGESRQLRMGLVLEVTPAGAAQVAQLMPRLQDAILGYLRAVEPATLAEPTALLILRAQMLRRARMILGGDAVANLLVTDFVLN